MNKKQELDRAYIKLIKKIDIHFLMPDNEHHQDYSLYTSLAEHLFNLENPRSKDFNIILDYFYFPLKVPTLFYFDWFFSSHKNLNESELKFYIDCIEQTETLINIFNEKIVLWEFMNTTYISPENDREIMNMVLDEINIKNYRNDLNRNPFNKQHLIELERKLRTNLTTIKDNENIRTITLRNETINTLHSNLIRYFNPVESLNLTKVLEGKTLHEKILFNGNQNQLAELFRRLKYNNQIDEKPSEIRDWLYTNFKYLKHGKASALNKSSVYEILLAKKSKTIAKDKRLLPNLYEYKTPSQLKSK